jgi:hypothetical protein
MRGSPPLQFLEEFFCFESRDLTTAINTIQYSDIRALFEIRPRVTALQRYRTVYNIYIFTAVQRYRTVYIYIYVYIHIYIILYINIIKRHGSTSSCKPHLFCKKILCLQERGTPGTGYGYSAVLYLRLCSIIQRVSSEGVVGLKGSKFCLNTLKWYFLRDSPL